MNPVDKSLQDFLIRNPKIAEYLQTKHKKKCKI